MTRRGGFSLAELIVALGLFSILLASTLGFYRQQGRAFTVGNERMTVMHNLRYALNTIEQNLRVAGVGVPVEQPVVVYAGADVVAFSANYASRDPNDLFAAYRDPSLDVGATTALTRARRLTLPGTSFLYPDTSYFVGSGNSPAETIIFFFQRDTTTARTDDYVLYRQVNDRPAEVIARRLLRVNGGPFFRYRTAQPGSDGAPGEIPAASLPVAHTVPIHGSPADTGTAALVDDIRAVGVSFAATNGLTGSRESVREVTRLIRLPNAGLGSPRICGSRPLLGTAFLATTVHPTQSEPGYVRLEWGQAIDERSGERDVLLYVLWRRISLEEAWGDPLVSVAAGSESYVYEDRTAETGVAYYYALAAQDCTPLFSDLAEIGPTVPLNSPPAETS